MSNIAVGDVVQSLKGRDANQSFVVVDIKDDYILLANGKNRTIQNPKKKKIKHIKIASLSLESIKQKLQSGNKVLDSEIRKAIDNLNII